MMFSVGFFRLAPRCGGEARFFNQINGIQVSIAHLNQMPSADYVTWHGAHFTNGTALDASIEL